MCVVHASHNRHEFYLRSLRFSFLKIPYCFSVSNLAERKLFLVPKLSNVPPKFLLFLPLASRYVHQQHYCISYLYHERYPHNIYLSAINTTTVIQMIFLFLPPILRDVPKLYNSFYHQYWEAAVRQWLRCCAKNRKVAGSIPASVSGFFIDIKSFRSHYGPGVELASNRNEYQEYFLGVKPAGAYG